MSTPVLGIPELESAQNQKYLTVNQALRYLDVLVNLNVISAALPSPPGSPTDHSQVEVTYGNHMALSMALGLLFLGGGSLTLGTSDAQLAALVVACFPRFPAHAGDNR